MPCKTVAIAHTIGIDTGKNTLHMIGLDKKGTIVVREKVSRTRIAARLVKALHRVRSRLIGNRTAVINQLRGFLLEHGIPVRQGLRFLRQQLPQILAMRTDVLSPRMIRIIEELIVDWEHLDERIERVTDEIETLARADENCRRLMTVPGIGPIIASAMVAAIGNGAAFAKGRDFAAWLGLVPKQMSTGDRTILGRITKRGNRYLRMLFIQGARAICFDRRGGPSIALDRGLRLRRGGCIATFWQPRSRTSWHGLL